LPGPVGVNDPVASTYASPGFLTTIGRLASTCEAEPAHGDGKQGGTTHGALTPSIGPLRIVAAAFVLVIPSGNPSLPVVTAPARSWMVPTLCAGRVTTA
jgi:hypothetical protein